MKNLIFIVFTLWISCSQKPDLPHVTKIYPSSDTLPENLLRMYVQFSEPMKAVGNLEKIKLIDQDGLGVPGAIFNNVYELWDERQQQLTLIFDPARVKTGLQANQRMGRALQRNRSYQLKIKDMETVTHMKVAPYLKEFYVAAADTIPPDTSNWNIQIPFANSRSPLTIAFPEIVDQMSLLHRLVVASEQKELITGSISIGKTERSWIFIPDENWRAGNYQITVNTRFADPSGNSLNGLFDHAIGSLNFESEEEILQLRFAID